MKIFITTIFAVAAVSHAKIIDITVGKIGNYFDPFNLNAQAGDKLRFNFYGVSNLTMETLTQSLGRM